MTTPSYESLTHSKWDCKYHIVFIPKGRKKTLYGNVRKFLGPVFHELASQRGSTIVEGHMVQDHVHMLIKIAPKYSVAVSSRLHQREKLHCCGGAILGKARKFQ